MAVNLQVLLLILSERLCGCVSRKGLSMQVVGSWPLPLDGSKKDLYALGKPQVVHEGACRVQGKQCQLRYAHKYSILEACYGTSNTKQNQLRIKKINV